MRTIFNLNQHWNFALHKGLDEFNRNDAKKLQFEEVTLPHDWAISSPFVKNMEQGSSQGFRDRWGIGWYTRDLFIEKEEGKKYILNFDGIYENSTVWVNETEVGGKKFGYSPFSLDITDALVYSATKHEIVVKVDNTTMPVDRWYCGAGIYRAVSLLVVPATHLKKDDVKLEFAFEGKKVKLSVHSGIKASIRAILLNEKFSLEATEIGSVAAIGNCDSKEPGVVHLSLNDYFSWSAEKPYLYTLRIQLLDGDEVADEVSFKVGFRSVEIDTVNGLRINGEHVKLKGVCLHQDAGSFGTAVQEEVWRNRLLELKKIGCNSLRLAHHLFMPQMLDLCDELGFYVYEECFDKWTGGAYGRFYSTEWEEDIACMVKRDRNRPSILIWGVGNEVENQAFPSMLTLLEKHIAKVKDFDRSRPVSLAINPHFSYPTEEVDMSKVEDIQQFVDEMSSGEIFDMDERVERIKLIAEKVDLLCCNYQEQWYERIHKAIPDLAILGTETYMYFRGYEEVYQNYTEMNPWWDAENNNYCIGGMIWTGIDYWGEVISYPSKGWSGALFATDMEKKPITWIMQSYWSSDPVLHFAVYDGSIQDEGVKEHWDAPRFAHHWDFPQYNRTVVPYMVATNCEEVELRVNDKNFLVPALHTFPNRVITGYLPYIAGKVTVIGKINGEEVCRQEVQTAGMAVKLQFEEEEQEIDLKQTTSDRGLEYASYQMLLKVRAFDNNGIPVFKETAKVNFFVEGSAEIIGVENGDIQSEEPNHCSFIHLYRGRADVTIRITGPGRVRISAYASGMFSGSCTVFAKDSSV